MVLGRKKEPQQHDWTKWRRREYAIWKHEAGFEPTDNYKGTCYEQTRICKLCNKLELDIQA